MRDTPNWREIYRYLGYKNGARPEGEALRLIERAEAGVRKAAEPRCVCRRLGLSFPAENTLDIGGILIKSAALRRNLDGCAGVYLFAATLGAGVDRLISGLTALGRVSEAAAAQAAAAALIEDCCDEENEPRRIGLTVTDSCMLAPMKSVTAVIGIAETEGSTAGGCEDCDKQNCGFRRQ